MINFHRINRINLIYIFDFLPFQRCLQLVKYNKKLHELLELNKNVFDEILKVDKILKPTYECIVKYIPNFISNKDEKNNKKVEIKKNNSILLNEKLFYKVLNSIPDYILIDIRNKYWKTIIKKIYKINLELNPFIIQYFDNMDEKERKEVLECLKKNKENIREISFNSFNDKNEINFMMRQSIKNILNYIWNSDKENKLNNKCYVTKVSFGDNSIMSVFDINNILIEIGNILYENTNSSYIEEFYINSKTAKNDIKNINNFILKKIPNVKFIELYDFSFLNNKNSSLLSNLLKNLLLLEKLDLTDSICNNNNLIEILNSNNLKLKELKIKILYGDKMINWDFLNKFIDFLEVLEIELIFPDKDTGFGSYQIIWDYRNKNISELFSIINKMKKLNKLKVIGEYLNNHDINSLHINNITDLTLSFYIVNPDLHKNSKNIKESSSISKLFLNLNKINKLSLKYNSFKQNISLFNNYDGIDFLCEYNKEKSYKLSLFEFSNYLSVLKLNNFIDNYFLEFFLIPLLNKNKEKLFQINELILNNCFLEVKHFEKFLSIISLMTNLLVLKINNILFYEKFKIKDLFNYVPTIFKNAPNLVELDISNNKYKEKIFIDDSFKNLSKIIPKNLINFKVFNSEIPISDKIIRFVKHYFGKLLDYENVVIKKCQNF